MREQSGNRRWICDACGLPIESPEQAVVEWLDRPAHPPAPRCGYAVQIVHYPRHSPPGRECRYAPPQGIGQDGVGSRDLTEFFGEKGLKLLFQMLESGRLEAAAAQELFMRVRVPLFEEVRAQLRAALAAAAPGPDRSRRFATLKKTRRVLERLTSGEGTGGGVVPSQLERSPDDDP